MNKVKHLTLSEIRNLERIYLANLINSVSGYKHANLIGTYSEKGIANLALFTSVVHLGANPPLIGHIQRPVGEFSHTYKNLVSNKYYTINHVHGSFIEKAHYTSAKLDETKSEFEACKLTEERLIEFNAPFVKESKIKLGMSFVKEIPIELNNTILIIGQVEHLFVLEEAILEDGNIDLNLAMGVCVSGLQTYHAAVKLNSFPYAKANNLPDF